MTARAKALGHDIHFDGEVWRITATGELLYTAGMKGSGQYARCIECGLMPTSKGHDGCLGTLVSDKHGGIQNACCGHGEPDTAYIQYVNKDKDGQHIDIRGKEAYNEQQRLLRGRYD